MSVKIGDELAFFRRDFGWVIMSVDRITSTGQIRCGHLRVTPSLKVIGRKIDRFSYVVRKPTAAIRDEARKNMVLKEVSDINWDKLDTGELRSVIDLVKTFKRGQVKGEN